MTINASVVSLPYNPLMMALVVLLSGSSVAVLPPVPFTVSKGMHAGNMVPIINVAGDAVCRGRFDVLQVDYRAFHARGDGDIPQP